MDRNETLADISNMLREFSEAARAVNADLILDADDIADRIDAAAKRETVAGDAAKLREALEEILPLAEHCAKEADVLADSIRGICKLKGIDTKTLDVAQHGCHAKIKRAKAALAVPPRNCDRFQKCGDAIMAYQSYLAKHGDEVGCLSWADWLFAEAEQEGGEK